jgi:hypothetical protein
MPCIIGDKMSLPLTQDFQKPSLSPLPHSLHDSLFPKRPGGVDNVVVSKQNWKSSKKKATDTNSSPGAGQNNVAADKLVRCYQQIANLCMSSVDDAMTQPITNNQPIAGDADAVPDPSEDSDDEQEDGHNGDSEEIVADEVCVEELTTEDILHGYVQDSVYNPAYMEDDGEYTEELEWQYGDIGNEQEDIPYPHYEGDVPALRPFVSR